MPHLEERYTRHVEAFSSDPGGQDLQEWQTNSFQHRKPSCNRLQLCSHLGSHKSWCLQNAAFLWSQARKMQRARPFGTSSERTFPEVNSEQKRKFCYAATRWEGSTLASQTIPSERLQRCQKNEMSLQGNEQLIKAMNKHLSRKSTRLLNHKYIQEGEDIHANKKLTFYVTGLDNVQPVQPSNLFVWQALKQIYACQNVPSRPQAAVRLLISLDSPKASSWRARLAFEMISNEDKAWATINSSINLYY